MTLCIAATCHEAGDPRIVLCFDAKGSSDLGSSETIWKYERLTLKYGALIAGVTADARELADIYREQMNKTDSVPLAGLSSLVEYLRLPAEMFRKRKINEFLVTRWGQNIEDFEATCNNENRRYEIANMLCPAWLIIAGFSGRQPVLFDYGHWAISTAEHYAAIGEGASVAMPILKYRSQAEHDTLSSTLYKVYEAKKLAEVYDSVGTDTKIIVLKPGTSPESMDQQVVNPQGIEFLHSRFLEYGPRAVPVMHDFPSEFRL